MRTQLRRVDGIASTHLVSEISEFIGVGLACLKSCIFNYSLMELVCSEDRKLLEEYGLVLERLQPSDLERWFDHLALVFDKTGRGYFVDHFNAEPDLDSILVIKSPINNSILSTMRIFDQQIVVGVQ